MYWYTYIIYWILYLQSFLVPGNLFLMWYLDFKTFLNSCKYRSLEECSFGYFLCHSSENETLNCVGLTLYSLEDLKTAGSSSFTYFNIILTYLNQANRFFFSFFMIPIVYWKMVLSSSLFSKIFGEI